MPIEHDSIIAEHHIPILLDYNINDILITLKLVKSQLEELNLRDKISNRYELDVRNDSRSSIGKKLMSLYYSNYTGIDYKDFKDLRTFRGNMRLSSIISPRIKFTTDKFRNFLDELKKKVITPSDKFNILFSHNGTTYTIAKGGIHSIDDSRMYDSLKDGCLYVDADVTSYYPSILLIFGIYPEHLNKDVFLALVELFKDDRVKAKDAVKTIKNKIKSVSEDELGDKLKVLNDYIELYSLEAEALKIVINRIYGALKDMTDYLFDPKATYQTTFNGQLSLLMLIEDLEFNGIHCISANTDGIICKVKHDEYNKYLEICKAWEEKTKFSLEYTNYERYVRNNVNDYIAVKEGYLDKYNSLSESDKLDRTILKKLEEEYVKCKGTFIDEVAFNKGFTHPITSIAIKRYCLYGEDYKETIRTHILKDKFNIYDYCISQKVDKKFDVEYIRVVNVIVERSFLQQYNRYYVCSKGGGSIVKTDNYKGKERMQQLVAKLKSISYSSLYSKSFITIRLLLATNCCILSLPL